MVGCIKASVKRLLKYLLFMTIASLLGHWTYLWTHPNQPSHKTISDHVAEFSMYDVCPKSFYSSPDEHVVTRDGECTMQTCFNLSMCTEQQFRVYIYPETEPVSQIYTNILSALRRSPYFTENPDEACLFVLGLDTVERDSLSNSYVRDMNEKMHVDPIIQQYWNGGRNHIIFNLKAGTFPYYHEKELGFDVGFASLAKASMSFMNFRKGFDVSLPLFQSSLLARGEDAGNVASRKARLAKRKYLLSFKGKRYLYGIGSDSRNFLYHINNQKDMLILTTCEHGKLSKSIRDERCDSDDSHYGRYDYQMLLHDSTFCLVPRGRRLDSFRFLEALQAGCIPVVLSNGLVLPFSEIIDWKAAVLFADERLITHIPTMVRSIKFEQIVAMRQQTHLLWRQYFSSVERIVLTTLEIIRNRLLTHHRPGSFWNTYPSLFYTQVPYLNTEIMQPSLRVSETDKFTVHISLASVNNLQTVFLQLLTKLNRTRSVGSIIIATNWKGATEDVLKIWALFNVPVVIVSGKNLTLDEIKTQAVIFVNDDCELTSEDFEQGFQLWRSFPDRIVGPHSASHFWDEFNERWQYSDKDIGDYSMVMMKDAFVHVQYYVLLVHYQAKVFPNFPLLCSDILLNFLTAMVSKFPPLKTSTKQLSAVSVADLDIVRFATEHRQHRECLNQLYGSFGFIPLIRSSAAEEAIFAKSDFLNRNWTKTS